MSDGRQRRAKAKDGWWKGLNPTMALAAKSFVLAFVLFAVRDVEAAGAAFERIRSWIEGTLDWYYASVVCACLFACLFLPCSRFGRIRLGDDASEPEFRTSSWLAMLFSAGVGIGLLFFSIAEPIFYFDNSQSAGYPNNPLADLAGAVSLDEARAVHAMRVVYFHWGMHGWAVYALVGLCLAYFGFRKKLPLTLRSALYPLIGDRIYGPIGDIVDLLAVFGTVFGIATTLGLGASQMATGLDVLLGVDPGLVTQVALIAAISAAATLSAVSGVSRGIRILSEWNIGLSVILLGSFLFLGPGTWLVGFLATSIGEYLWHALPMGFWIADDPGQAVWQNRWTIFYWGWWISWAPFVGMFIARISRGRTLREFHAGRAGCPDCPGAAVDRGFRWQRHLPGAQRGGRRRNRRDHRAGAGRALRGRALRDHRQVERHRLADVGHVRPGYPSAGDVVHYVLGLRHVGHNNPAEHGRPPPTPAFPHRLGTRHRSGDRRAAARRRPPGLADRRHGRRPAGEHRAVAYDRWADEVPGAGSVVIRRWRTAPSPSHA